MCLRNVNATMLMFSAAELDNPANISFLGMYDSVIPVSENNSFYLENLNIALSASIIFDDRFATQSDYFHLEQTYEFVVRLTHVVSKRGITLSKFELTVKQDDLKTWCKSFYELKRFIKVHHLLLPLGMGDYALKLMIRPKTDDPDAGWNTQTIHSLSVGGSR